MRRLFALATLGIFLGSATSRSARSASKSVSTRESRAGNSPKKEALKLEKKQAQLHREIKKERKDGGGLTAKERAKIHKKQDKLSRQIAKEKHDDQKRDK